MTMLSVSTLQLSSQTAIAAYSDIRPSDLVNSLKGDPSHFTQPQADSFTSSFTLVHQLTNVPFKSFCAAVFKATDGTHVLAIRGTEPDGWQIYTDLLREDIATIGGNGFAKNHVVELYRYYRRLITLLGEAVSYSATEVLQRLAMKVGSFSVPGIIGVSLLAALGVELALDRGETPTSGNLQASVLSPTEKIIVTGHGLGGQR